MAPPAMQSVSPTEQLRVMACTNGFYIHMRHLPNTSMKDHGHHEPKDVYVWVLLKHKIDPRSVKVWTERGLPKVVYRVRVKRVSEKPGFAPLQECVSRVPILHKDGTLEVK